jgi:hypothetical protein
MVVNVNGTQDISDTSFFQVDAGYVHSRSWISISIL